MLLRDVVLATRRRWLAAILGLLATVGLVFGTLAIVHPQYEAKASVLLLPPQTAVEAGGNPYLQLGGLRQAVDLVVIASSDQRTEKFVKGLSSTAKFQLVADPNTSSPTIRVTVQDRSAALALRVRDQLVALIPERLSELQSSIAIETERQVTSERISADTTATVVGQARLRAAIVAGAAGLAFTALFVALRDNLLLRRSRRSGAESSTNEP